MEDVTMALALHVLAVALWIGEQASQQWHSCRLFDA